MKTTNIIAVIWFLFIPSLLNAGVSSPKEPGKRILPAISLNRYNQSGFSLMAALYERRYSLNLFYDYHGYDSLEPGLGFLPRRPEMAGGSRMGVDYRVKLPWRLSLGGNVLLDGASDNAGIWKKTLYRTWNLNLTCELDVAGFTVGYSENQHTGGNLSSYLPAEKAQTISLDAHFLPKSGKYKLITRFARVKSESQWLAESGTLSKERFHFEINPSIHFYSNQVNHSLSTFLQFDLINEDALFSPARVSYQMCNITLGYYLFWMEQMKNLSMELVHQRSGNPLSESTSISANINFGQPVIGEILRIESGVGFSRNDDKSGSRMIRGNLYFNPQFRSGHHVVSISISLEGTRYKNPYEDFSRSYRDAEEVRVTGNLSYTFHL